VFSSKLGTSGFGRWLRAGPVEKGRHHDLDTVGEAGELAAAVLLADDDVHAGQLAN
jgi:hypothetical protein